MATVIQNNHGFTKWPRCYKRLSDYECFEKVLELNPSERNAKELMWQRRLLMLAAVAVSPCHLFYWKFTIAPIHLCTSAELCYFS